MQSGALANAKVRYLRYEILIIAVRKFVIATYRKSFNYHSSIGVPRFNTVKPVIFTAVFTNLSLKKGDLNFYV